MATSIDFRISHRPVIVFVSLLCGALFIIVSTRFYNGSPGHVILFGGVPDLFGGVPDDNVPQTKKNWLPPFPFTMQNLMWLLFFVGCGEIWVRFVSSSRDLAPLKHGLLPEDPEKMLRANDLGPIYQRVHQGNYAEDSFLPRLIKRAILQFQSSRSIDQANSLLNSTLELCQHEIDLRYNMLRYLVWLLPTLGFLGTVIGIAIALNEVGEVKFNNEEEMQKLMPSLTRSLGVAFYTTLLALMQSAVLVFALHVAQAREERVLNRAGQYCLDNLINRLWDR